MRFHRCCVVATIKFTFLPMSLGVVCGIVICACQTVVVCIYTTTFKCYVYISFTACTTGTRCVMLSRRNASSYLFQVLIYCLLLIVSMNMVNCKFNINDYVFVVGSADYNCLIIYAIVKTDFRCYCKCACIICRKRCVAFAKTGTCCNCVLRTCR